MTQIPSTDLTERLRILEDTRQLKQLAIAFLHPERPVEVDSTFCARCYFDRFSAPQQETFEEAEERHMALTDAAALKRLAIDYAHPEIGVETSDSLACARCYFDRDSAPKQESMEDAEERHLILEDVKHLRRAAFDYMHPEVGVVTSDPTATARCFFNRASAAEQESTEDAEERHMALADAAALKRLAIDYMHPELGVVTSDPTATARCFFDRHSAPFIKDTITSRTTKAVVPKKAFKTVSIMKDTGVKTIETHLGSSIRKSASAVHLYGLDNNDDPAFF